MAAAQFLIVEDEAMIAMLVEDSLEDMGHGVMAICSNVDEALAALSGTVPSAAILDINLGRQTSWPIARALQSLAIPYIVTSGNADVHFPDDIIPVSILAKPFAHAALEDTVNQLLS